VGSTAIGEAALLIISGIMVFYGTMSWSSLIKLLLSDYAIRLCFAIVGGLPANIIIHLLKLKWFQDDESILQNPFSNHKIN
jgi:hypothetical protein